MKTRPSTEGIKASSWPCTNSETIKSISVTYYAIWERYWMALKVLSMLTPHIGYRPNDRMVHSGLCIVIGDLPVYSGRKHQGNRYCWCRVTVFCVIKLPRLPRRMLRLFGCFARSFTRTLPQYYSAGCRSVECFPISSNLALLTISLT